MARIDAARAALTSPESADEVLVLRTSPEPPVAFFVSLTPRKIGPRVGVELACEAVVCLIPAGRSVVGCRKWPPDLAFRGERLRRRFEGCGLEGSQWVVRADTDGVILESDVSTNGTRLVRNDPAALSRLRQQPLRFGDLVRDDVGSALPLQTKCALALQEGDVLATFFEAWVFAPVRP